MAISASPDDRNRKRQDSIKQPIMNQAAQYKEMTNCFSESSSVFWPFGYLRKPR